MRIAFFALLLFWGALITAQINLVILPVDVSVNAGYGGRLFGYKSKEKNNKISETAKHLDHQFKGYAKEVIDGLEATYADNFKFIRHKNNLSDDLASDLFAFDSAINQALFRNQRKKDDGFRLSVYSKGWSNRNLKEVNEGKLQVAAKPFAVAFDARYFLYFRVTGKQSATTAPKGIVGGIRIQAIIIDANTGETVYFKTFSNGSMKTPKSGSQNNARIFIPKVNIRKQSFQKRLKNTINAALARAVNL